MILAENENLRLKLADIYPVKEIFDDKQFSVGVANKQEDIEGRLNVATQRYILEEYISRENLTPQGFYVDEYEAKAVPLVAKHKGIVVASFRIIPNDQETGPPINNEVDVREKIFPAWKERVLEAPFELSQLAKLKGYHRYPQPTMGVIKTYMAIADSIGKKTSVAVIDDGVVDMLNGPFLGFELEKIGESVGYMGSKSTPVFIDIDKVRENTEKNGHPELARFLWGEKNVPEYEWYVGP